MKTRFLPFLAASAIAFSACFPGQEQKLSENGQDTTTLSEAVAAKPTHNVLYNVVEQVGPTFKQGEEETRP